MSLEPGRTQDAISAASDHIGVDVGDNYPRGLHMWAFDSEGASFGSKVVYSYKTHHATASGDGAYAVYDAISGGDVNVTYYRWSNDNNVYTELAHQGIVELDDRVLLFFSGENSPPLDNGAVGATAWSKWPSWRGHNRPPHGPPLAPQAASEGVGLLSALVRRGTAPRVPQSCRDVGARPRPRRHFHCI